MIRLRRFAVLSALAALTAAVSAVGCHSSGDNDPPAVVTPNALGPGPTIAEITNPNLANHPKSGTSVSLTGAAYLWLDTFDETGNGKSIGDIYFQDFCPTPPCNQYSGISGYEQTFEPADTVPEAGDVFDFTTATYEEETNIGSADFTPPEVLIQVAKPIITYRFQAPEVPQPTVVNVTDLNAWATGRPWTSMLITVNNLTVTGVPYPSGGRWTAPITSDTTQNGVVVSNALFDLATWNAQNGNPIAIGKTIKSLTGIVTWFDNFQICPRTAADIVLQ